MGELSESDMKHILRMLAEGKSEDDVRAYLESKNSNGGIQTKEFNQEEYVKRKELGIPSRKEEIKKKEVENFTIDINTMSTEEIFKKYF